MNTNIETNPIESLTDEQKIKLIDMASIEINARKTRRTRQAGYGFALNSVLIAALYNLFYKPLNQLNLNTELLKKVVANPEIVIHVAINVIGLIMVASWIIRQHFYFKEVNHSKKKMHEYFSEHKFQFMLDICGIDKFKKYTALQVMEYLPPVIFCIVYLFDGFAISNSDNGTNMAIFGLVIIVIFSVVIFFSHRREFTKYTK